MTYQRKGLGNSKFVVKIIHSFMEMLIVSVICQPSCLNTPCVPKIHSIVGELELYNRQLKYHKVKMYGWDYDKQNLKEIRT